MASASSFDSCNTCLIKHQRTRPSLCQCKHCSESFCFDCMKDHNDDLQQVNAQLINRYNEMKQLVKKKRNLITNETIKSKEQMTTWLKKCIDNLNAEKARIDINIDKAEKDAQKFVGDIETELEELKTYVENLSKNNIFQVQHTEKLTEKLNALYDQLSPLAETREHDLPSPMPKYKFKFDYPSKSNIQQPLKIPEWSDEDKSTTTEEFDFNESLPDIETSESETDDSSFPGDDYFSYRNKFELTSFTINCMASDGRNIMYSTIEDSQKDRIAYCYLDNNHSHYEQTDANRTWNQSRIVDMVWWDTIDKFICATETGLYTVEYLDEKFRISSVVQNRWVQVRIAVNTDHLWVHTAGKLMIYNTNFELLRLINFYIPRSLTRLSFCVTNNLIAFALIRRVENNRDILHIEFYNHDMQRGKRVKLGVSETSCILRTDGNERFYLAMGQQKLYIISPNGTKQTINLGKQANYLAVVNSRNIVVTKSRADVELVRC